MKLVKQRLFGAPPIRLALRCAWPYRGVLGAAVVAMLLARGAVLALPWIGGLVVAGLFAGGAASPGALAGLMAIGLGLIGLQAALGFAGSYLSLKGGELAITDLREKLYDQVQSRRLDFVQRRRAGEIVALFGFEVETVSYYVTDTLLAAIPTALTVVGALVLIGWRDPLLAALALASIPVFLIALRFLARRIHPRMRRLAAERAVADGMLQENLALLPAIKAHRREAFESRRYRRQLDRVLDAMLGQQWGYLGVGAVTFFFAGAISLAIAAVGAWRVSGGALAPAELVTILLYGVVMIQPLTALGGVYSHRQSALGAAERLQAAFDAAGEENDGGTAELPAGGVGEVELEELGFGYGGEPVLDGASLTIAPGETVALVGSNGAGKTTLAHLMMRFYAPQRGRIRVDGVDIAEVSLQDLRRHVALVPQVDLLARGTIRDNIAWGRPEASDAEVRRAAEAAGAAELIAALPGGYDTVIGERGVTLSGGQRQRISLARALLTDARVLILDEATAMFDPEGEVELLRSARQALAGRTVVLITHRPAMLAIADRVVRLERGQLVDALPLAAPRKGAA